MSEKKKGKPIFLIMVLVILILPISSLIVLLLYQAPRHFGPGVVNNLIDETADFALTFQTQDGLFVEPSIDTIYNTITTYYNINGTSPFFFSNLNHSSLSHFLLTHMNSDGGYSDFAGAGNILSTYEALFALNMSSPTELSTNPTIMNQTLKFVNESQLDDGGYSIRPSIEMLYPPSSS